LFFDFIKRLSNNDYKNIVDNTNYLRMLLSWGKNGMDLYQIIKIMWTEEVKTRLSL
jgi:hypothetical protein